MSKWARWSDEHTEILREEYPKGVLIDVLAEKLSRSPGAISAKAHHMGLKHPFRNGNTEYGNYRRTLMHRLQEEPHCVVCGIRKYLTINHIFHKLATSGSEWKYWLKQPIEEARKNLNIMCMNHNKIDAYNHYGYGIGDNRRAALERVALAHSRPVKCFECGYDEDIRVLEIDHLVKDGYKTWELYRHILSTDLEEVEECYQILCSNHNLWKGK